MIKNLSEERAARLNDNSLWTPRDCAEAFLRDIDSGENKPSRVLIIYEEEQPNGDKKILAYRANVQRDTEIAMLWMKLHMTTQDWIR